MLLNEYMRGYREDNLFFVYIWYNEEKGFLRRGINHGFFLFYGYIIISIFIFIIFFGTILIIKASGGNVYLEMLWNKILVISIIVGLVISPIWIIMCLNLIALAGRADVWEFTVIASYITMFIYIIIIVFCAVGNDRKNKIIQRNNKN